MKTNSAAAYNASKVISVVSLHEPAAYQYSGAGESIPLNVVSKLPFVTMKIPLAGASPLKVNS